MCLALRDGQNLPNLTDSWGFLSPGQCGAVGLPPEPTVGLGRARTAASPRAHEQGPTAVPEGAGITSQRCGALPLGRLLIFWAIIWK